MVDVTLKLGANQDIDTMATSTRNRASQQSFAFRTVSRLNCSQTLVGYIEPTTDLDWVETREVDQSQQQIGLWFWSGGR